MFTAKQRYSQQNILCKSTLPNSLATVFNKCSLAPKINPNARLSNGVIKLTKSASIKKLLKTHYTNQDKIKEKKVEYDKYMIIHPQKTEPERNFVKLNVLKHKEKKNCIFKQTIKEKLMNKFSCKKYAVEKSDESKSRNCASIKYETCIGRHENNAMMISKVDVKDKHSDSGESYLSDGCNTIIEYECDNNYSLICDSLNKVFT